MWNQNSQQNTAKQPLTKPATASGPATPSEPSVSRAPQNGSTQPAGLASTIAKSIVVKGEITGSESLYIDGKVEGSINLPGNRVTVGPNGQVAASISAREVVVQGKIVGNVTASDRLEVMGEGSLIGDAVAQRVSIEDGAFFKGKIDIRRPGQPSESLSTAPERKGAELPLGAAHQMDQLQVV